MDLYDVLGIAAVLIALLLGVLAFYFRAKGNAVEMIAELIALAEQEADKTGPEKMDMVVSWLYDYIPAAFRGILSKEALREIAQGVFNWTRRYAMEYLEGKKKPPDGYFVEYEIPDEGDDGK